ncbi:hypothetical protein Aab01nite_46260 [Paractinoplanes abujensis]|uniref:Uncharacterized protein n=1 Tax=Paractinoplanes abujensis TaxID=882441 RepID=A0A7W7CNG3_9ACTN|nr:hypothetical protein [Actinoplanes abujensis]MBB4690273.1 hypothetical protein [Actinoplanes abujensis]GID21036.1 hypothetical protein Aab01nite_46260 [Actinoplanes abujensis]
MTDELIQAAFEKIAATAPPPERIRARLLARSRSHRQRRAVLAGAGALAATAVTIPFVHAVRRVPAPVAPPGATPARPSPEPPATAALRYTPGWLPAGVGERYREATTGGGTRTWTLDGAGQPTDGSIGKGVTLMVGERIDDDSGLPVTIGDVTGRLRVTDASFVEWTPRGGPPLVVAAYGLPDSTAVALRTARSVHPTTSTMPVWIRAPWVPGRFRGTTAAILRPLPGGGWLQQLTFTPLGSTGILRVVAATEKVPERALHEIRRPDGVWLSVPATPRGRVGSAPLDSPTRAEAVRVLDELVCVAPDMRWLGSRDLG